MLLEMLLVYVYCNLCFTLYLIYLLTAIGLSPGGSKRFTVFGVSINVDVFMLFVISVLP